MTGYLYPGCGFGGYCLPKDIAALLHTARAAGVKADVLRGVIAANDAIARHFVTKIVRATKARTRICILGLSFKPGSDDVRETPAARIIELLLQHGRKKLVAYDPMANESYRRAYPHPIKYADSLAKAVQPGAAVVVLSR